MGHGDEDDHTKVDFNYVARETRVVGRVRVSVTFLESAIIYRLKVNWSQLVKDSVQCQL
jgi:hypothetical protein